MAVFSRDIIKSWFKRGLKPTEVQFANTWDSFWHKLESISISAIAGLQGALNAKANVNHNHTIENITGLAEALEAAGESGLSSNITTTVSSAGGIAVGVVLPQGMTFTEYVRSEHAPYVQPSFTAFAINGNVSGVLEVGQTLTVSNATFTIKNDSEGNPPSDKHVVGTGFESAALVSSSPHLADAVNKSIVRYIQGSESWVITGKDSNNANTSRTANRTWYHALKFGASATIVDDPASAQQVYAALQQKWLQANAAKTVICTADNQNINNYTYIVYPKSFGLLSNIIQNGALPVFSAFTLLDEFPADNIFGVSTTHYFYISNAPGAFELGTSLAIT